MPCTITTHPCYLLHFLLWNSQCEARCYVNYLTKAWVPNACSLKETSSPHLSSFMLKSGPFKVPLCDSYYFLYPYCNNNKKYFVNCNISHPQLCDFHMSSRLTLSVPPTGESWFPPCVSLAILLCIPSFLLNMSLPITSFPSIVLSEAKFFLEGSIFLPLHFSWFLIWVWIPQKNIILIQLHVGFFRIQVFYTSFFNWNICSFLPCLQYICFNTISHPIFYFFYDYVTSKMKEDI